MNGILRSDGGFAEYMIASHEALVHLPEKLSFEQAAPLMCAGVRTMNLIFSLPWLGGYAYLLT